MLLIIFFIILILFIYFKLIKPLEYWEKRGVPHLKPWPILGNLGSICFKRQTYGEKIQELYNAFPEKRYIGFYQLTKPSIFLRDLELIKQIAVKDFNIFPEHKRFIPEGVDPLWNKSLPAIKGGDKWNHLKSTLSPAFTVSKLKSMFPVIKNCSRRFIDDFLKQGEIVTVDAKQIFSTIALNVIGSTILGIDYNSLKNPSNELYLLIKELSSFNGLKGILFLLHNLSPTMMKIFKIRMFNKKIYTFFKQIVEDNKSLYTEENQIVRSNIIHLLLEDRKQLQKNKRYAKSIESGLESKTQSKLENIKQNHNIEITDEDIAAQAFILFAAGIDTTSTAMSFVCYELAINVEVQKKLIKEVDETFHNCNGVITYEALLEMKYLDSVISETLRLWPPIEFTERVCVKGYTIQAKLPNEASLGLEPDTDCWIPVLAIHKDPKYHPYPDKFDPERFNQENRNKINPLSYIPFGIGPRSCIGTRFALLQIKLIIFEILCKFQIEVVEKTQIPLILKKGTFATIAEGGTWLGLKPRDI